MSQPQILMCPPKYYGIEYEINPWMSRHRQANHEIASQQWEQLVAILQDAGATVSHVGTCGRASGFGVHRQCCGGIPQPDCAVKFQAPAATQRNAH